MVLRAGAGIAIDVACGDILSFAADVLALKHAGGTLYGVDREVVAAVDAAGAGIREMLPRDGEALLNVSRGGVKAPFVLFVGTPALYEFQYAEIRVFSRQVLSLLAGQSDIRHIALTLHGPGYGLDESEAFRAEVAGLLDAISADEYPPSLERITIVELSAGRAGRLTRLLSTLEQPSLASSTLHDSFGIQGRKGDARESFDDAGATSSEKPHVFVAMPFAEEFDDLFHYGIQGAVNAAGYLCERADLASFTGDVIEWVKNRIANAKLLVADLTSANPNVYLEVGYAWGKGVPTVLLSNDERDLKFNVRGQRCLIYKNIRHLEGALANELKAIRP